MYLSCTRIDGNIAIYIYDIISIVLNIYDKNNIIHKMYAVG